MLLSCYQWYRLTETRRMHVGMALRTGYFLGLDRTSHRLETAEEARIDGRKRLAWAHCYVSDRLISVRIGKAFWSRGPGPMTGVSSLRNDWQVDCCSSFPFLCRRTSWRLTTKQLSSQDFPSLQPLGIGDEDYAKIMAATLDLVQLYSNVHDVLYSGVSSSPKELPGCLVVLTPHATPP